MKIFKPIITVIAYFITGMMELLACYMFPSKDTLSFVGILALVTLIGFIATFYNTLAESYQVEINEQE